MIKIADWIDSLSFLKKALLSFALGALVAASLAPLHLVFLLPISFSGLILILGTAKNRKQAFFIGWWFAWGQFIAGLYWIGVAFTVDAATHALLIPLPVLGLPAFLAIFSGLATLATHICGVKGIYRILVFSGFWILFEYVRGVIFTGFPWNLVGYSWTAFLPILQSTAFIGIYGLTLLTVLVSSLPALLMDKTVTRKISQRAIIVGGSVIVLLFALGEWRLLSHPDTAFEDINLRIVQPNIPQAVKWIPELRLGHLRKIVEMSAANNGLTPDHLIWPETAVPYYLAATPKLLEQLAEYVPEGGSIITGAPRRDHALGQYWNSLHVLEKTGKITGTYDKQHLVPYGEYMPFRDFMMATGLTQLIPALDQMSDFAVPDENASRIIQPPGMPPARAMICYEIAFPWEVAPDADFSWILNVTNDGWFGNTSGPYQHLAMTITRAVEQGVPVVRAANTGISAVIDPYGRIIAEIGLNKTDVIDSQLPSSLEMKTLYARSGEYFTGFMVVILILFGAVMGRRGP